jgi:hypothetical protein
MMGLIRVEAAEKPGRKPAPSGGEIKLSPAKPQPAQ